MDVPRPSMERIGEEVDAEEFERLLGCTLREFVAMKPWKQRQLIQIAGLGQYTSAELLDNPTRIAAARAAQRGPSRLSVFLRSKEVARFTEWGEGVGK